MNTPYVLGPVGGGERIPFSLRKAFTRYDQVKILARRMTQRLIHLNPVVVANLWRASQVFVRTEETLSMIPRRYRHKTALLMETAIGPEMIAESPLVCCGDVLQVVSVGRLIPSKFNALFLDAVQVFKSRWQGPFRVTVIGDGPERARLEALRDQLGLEEVEFVGKKSSDHVYRLLRSSDIYFSTTMKEGGTWAFFEAIANHLPIVCLKVNGPDMIVGDGCGIKVQPDCLASATDGLASGLVELARSPSLRAELAAKAIVHVEKNFTWARVSQRVDSCYRNLVGIARKPFA
jgi:glycosyltransferase involved in cell wall biosynthesis